MSGSSIKSMKLYSQVDRIYNDLANLGVAGTDSLSVDLISPFDQFHYFGTEAVEEAICVAGITKNSRVLDVGSGLGGPARYLAEKTGCRVTAVELQPDMDAVASSLTQRCGLSDQVQHLCGDVLTATIEEGVYDAVVSWLAIYHIVDRNALFGRMRAALKPGGQIYIEDLYGLGEFTDEERFDLENMLYGLCVPARETYIEDLARAGFADIDFHDMTRSWSAFTTGRLAAYRAARADHVEVHGEDMVDALDAFYSAVAHLFESGKLGGVRLTGHAG